MNLKKSLTLIFCLISLSLAFAQKSSKVTVADLKPLIGKWQGGLTYLDYSSGKPFTMPANVDIERSGAGRSFLFINSYPKEPNANSTDTMILSKNGSMFDGSPVKSKRMLSDGNTEIITEILKTDGNENKPAVLRHTYIIGRKIYINRKDVQFTGQTNWIMRNEYKYSR